MPARSATRATARSPSWCIIRVKPVGANRNGSSLRRPSTSTPRSTLATSRSTLGWNSTPAYASRALLLLGGAVGVVEHGPRRPALGDGPQVPDGVGLGQAALDRRQRQPAGLEQLAQFRWAGQSSGRHGAPFPPGLSVPDILPSTRPGGNAQSRRRCPPLRRRQKPSSYSWSVTGSAHSAGPPMLTATCAIGLSGPPPW